MVALSNSAVQCGYGYGNDGLGVTNKHFKPRGGSHADARQREQRRRNSGKRAPVESRVNAALGRSDLRAVPLMRVEPRGPSAEGLSFQEFRKVCQSPRLLYRDIFVEGSLAERVDEVSLQDFESSGGRLTRYEV
nr:putative integron gene cassette protein [uncultured bacterium]